MRDQSSIKVSLNKIVSLSWCYAKLWLFRLRRELSMGKHFPYEFKSKKAAQIAAYFAQQKGGIDKMALIKLIYLMERAFIKKYGSPMLYDEFFSMEHGPICSSVLDGINSSTDYEFWPDYIKLSGIKDVTPVSKFTRDDLDELSDAEFEILEKIWSEHGTKTASELRNYTHRHCSEYEDVEAGYREPISYEKLLIELKVPDRDCILAEIDETKRTQRILSV